MQRNVLGSSRLCNAFVAPENGGFIIHSEQRMEFV